MNLVAIYFSLAIYFILFHIACKSIFGQYYSEELAPKKFASLDKLFMLIYLIFMILLIFQSMTFKAKEKF